MIKREEAERISVILADDNRAILDTVAELLESTSEFKIVGAVADGAALIEAATELAPQLGIIDISMPVNGLTAAAEIRKLGSKMKIIFLTVHEDRDFVRAALETGASAYVIKRCMASDLEAAIHHCMAGRTFISKGCLTALEP